MLIYAYIIQIFVNGDIKYLNFISPKKYFKGYENWLSVFSMYEYVGEIWIFLVIRESLNFYFYRSIFISYQPFSMFTAIFYVYKNLFAIAYEKYK